MKSKVYLKQALKFYPLKLQWITSQNLETSQLWMIYLSKVIRQCYIPKMKHQKSKILKMILKLKYKSRSRTFQQDRNPLLYSLWYSYSYYFLVTLWGYLYLLSSQMNHSEVPFMILIYFTRETIACQNYSFWQEKIFSKIFQLS